MPRVSTQQKRLAALALLGILTGCQDPKTAASSNAQDGGARERTDRSSMADKTHCA